MNERMNEIILSEIPEEKRSSTFYCSKQKYIVGRRLTTALNILSGRSRVCVCVRVNRVASHPPHFLIFIVTFWI